MRALIFIYLLLVTSISSAQSLNDNDEWSNTNMISAYLKGSPALRYFDQQAYKGNEEIAQPQNWDIIQDFNSKIIYFANTGGVLSYDGSRWETISIKNVVAKSLAQDKDGVIYVGGNSEFGRLVLNGTEGNRYESISTSLDTAKHKFGSIWKIAATTNGVYFQSPEKFFRYHNDSLTVIESKIVRGFHLSFLVGDSLYVRETGTGIYLIDGDRLRFLGGSEIFKNIRIYTMLPLTKNSILIGTREQGLWIYENDRFRQLLSDADQFLNENYLRCGARLPNGNIALGSIKAGVIIINSEGKFVRHIGKAEGLENQYVKYIFTDFEHNTWLALDSGIALLGLTSPISYFPRDPLPGSIKRGVLSVTRHAGKIWAGTMDGLYVQAMDTAFQANYGLHKTRFFKRTNEMWGPCWALLSLGDRLLAGTSAGIFEVQDNAIFKHGSLPTYVFYHDSLQNKIWIGSLGGIERLVREAEQWKHEIIDQEIGETRTLAGDGNYLFAANPSTGIFRLTVAEETDSTNNSHSVQFNDTLSAIGPEYHVFSSKSGILAVANGRLFKYSYAENAFQSYPDLGAEFVDDRRNLFRFAEDKPGHKWIHANNENLMVDQQGKYDSTTAQNVNLRSIPDAQINVIYPDASGDVVFGGNDGLVIYNNDVQLYPRKSFPALIKHIEIGQDTILFDNQYFTSQQGQRQELEVSFDRNQFVFTVAAPTFDVHTNTSFQYLIQGLDDFWSKWESKTQKFYPFIPAGSYIFRVRAKNRYGVVSEEAKFNFRVLEVWYWSDWAKRLYGLVTLLSIYLLLVNGNLRRKQKLYLREELANAKEAQNDLIPNTFPSIPGFTIAGHCEAAYEVGGDHYDYAWIEQGKRLAISLVDVEGKRMQGAIPSTLFNGLLNGIAFMNYELSLAEIAIELDRLLYRKLKGKTRVSLILAILDIHRGAIEYVNAGCYSPIHIQNGSPTAIQRGDFAFNGSLGDGRWSRSTQQLEDLKIYKCTLAAGESLVLYSDGVVEAQNQDWQKFGGQFRKLLAEIQPNMNAREMVAMTMNALRAFANSRSPSDDDKTLIIIKRSH